MQVFLLVLVAVIAVSANALPVEETGDQSPIRVCEPGQTKMEDCNTCHCVGDGSGYACTRMGCPPKLPLATCEPGKNFKLYCNTCMCPPDGNRANAACTLMGCVGIWTEDGTLVDPGQPLVDPTPRQRTGSVVERLG